ncbi:ribosomal protein L7/L12 [Streptomyces sp. NPDC048248]|uniref:ribosomal protein L7/L12 n=1 Tax=Streptomyces sp. NPDC048248 TaxID=3365523 RepID=UPI0037107653
MLVCDEPGNDVVLVDRGTRPIEVVRALHKLTGLSLWRSKVATAELPATLLRDASDDQAAALVEALREAGAQAEVRQAQTPSGRS